MKLIPRAPMPGFSPCNRCETLTDNKELKAFEDRPRTYYCPECIERIKVIRAL